MPGINSPAGQNRLVLQQITRRILASESAAIGSVFQAADELYRLFLNVSNLDWRKGKHAENMALSSGTALGAAWAGMCIKDGRRTQTFIRGVYQAILDMQRMLPGTTIQVLYAGTGPFATLALPLTTVFQPEAVQFTLLEVNPESAKMLRAVIDAFDARPYVRAMVEGDATAYQVHTGTPVHVLVIETMQPALLQEPQIAIAMNLAPQLAPSGVMVPREIVVHAGLLHPQKDMARMKDLHYAGTAPYHLLKEVLVWNRQSAELQAVQTVPTRFKEVMVPVPHEYILSGYKHLCLFTAIHVYGKERLNFWESQLNTPQLYLKIADKVEKVGFQYVLDNHPRFEYRVIA